MKASPNFLLLNIGENIGLAINASEGAVQERREAGNQHEPDSPPETSGRSNGIEMHQNISVQFTDHRVKPALILAPHMASEQCMSFILGLQVHLLQNFESA